MQAAKATERAKKASRLSARNRQAITESALAEPSIGPEIQPMSITEAIADVHTDKRIAHLQKLADFGGTSPVPALGAELFRTFVEGTDPLVGLRPPAPFQETPESMPAAVTNIPDTETPTPVLRQKISDETRKEVAEAYASDMSTSEICRAWNIGPGSLYNIVKQYGLPKRDPNRGASAPIPAPEVVAAPAPAPVSSNGVAHSGLSEWRVTYTVTRTVSVNVLANNFGAAADAAVSNEPAAEITSIVQVSV